MVFLQNEATRSTPSLPPPPLRDETLVHREVTSKLCHQSFLTIRH